MNDHDPLSGNHNGDPDLGERMQRAVGGLHAPDVLHLALDRGRRQRTHRRVAYGAGGFAAATALVLAVPALAGDWPGQGDDSSGPPVATDPTPTRPTAAPGGSGSGDDPCGPSATGWWSKSAAQIRSELSARLPDGTRIGGTDDDATGTWGGNLVTGDDADFASLTLLPPPGTPGGRLTLEELASGGPCSDGLHAPLQPVTSCDELTGTVTCEEIRSGGGALVGVVTEQVEQAVVDGQHQPTDKTSVLATIKVSGGGHVELYVAEGTRADTPGTVHASDDVPALTVEQVRDIVTDPVWAS